MNASFHRIKSVLIFASYFLDQKHLSKGALSKYFHQWKMWRVDFLGINVQIPNVNQIAVWFGFHSTFSEIINLVGFQNINISIKYNPAVPGKLIQGQRLNGPRRR